MEMRGSTDSRLFAFRLGVVVPAGGAIYMCLVCFVVCGHRFGLGLLVAGIGRLRYMV